MPWFEWSAQRTVKFVLTSYSTTVGETVSYIKFPILSEKKYFGGNKI